MLETKNVFIDTQVFVSSNFFQSNNHRSLAYWCSLNFIEDLNVAQIGINRFKDLISKKARILKNLPDFKDYIDLRQLNVAVDFIKLAKEFDALIYNGNVQMIP